MPPRAAYTRSDVIAMKAKWTIIRDCLSGEEAIKGVNRYNYLPVPAVEANQAETDARYAAYLKRAVFYNVTARTLNGMVGQVYSKPPIVELPAKLQLLVSNVDGSGVSLEQQSKKGLRGVLGLGRAGLLVDYPNTAGQGATLDVLAMGYLRPQILQFDAESIINWRTVFVGGRILLSLLVLTQQVEDVSQDYELRYETLLRVYRRSDDGVVTLQQFRYGPATQPTEGPAEVIYDHEGKPFDEIPFSFVGVENNDATIDLPPLYDLAILNLGHYRNSADFEESSFIVGQPTLWMSGLTEHWVNNVLHGTVRMGSRGGIPLPPQAQAGLLQAQPNSLPGIGMKDKEQQMVALGARLVQMQQVQRTATEASQDKVSEVSVLASSARNMSAAYTYAFKFAARFVGEDPSTIKFELTTDYDAARMTPGEQLQLVADWQAGAITGSEMRFRFRQGGIATEDDATWEAETKEVRDAAKQVLVGSQLPAASKKSTSGAGSSK